MAQTQRPGLAFVVVIAWCVAGYGGSPIETRFLPERRKPSAAVQADVRTILARRCATPPAIDASLDDAVWRDCEPAGGFAVLRDSARRMILSVVGSLKPEAPVFVPAGRDVKARLLYDSRYLYAGFEIEEPEPGKVKKDFQSNDEMLLWRDDTVEMILDPDCDRKRYFHFMINANAKVTDGEFGPGIRRLDRAKWTCQWQCACRLAGGKWIAEIAVPFEDLRTATPAPGATWLANFGHSKYGRFRRKLPSGAEVTSEGEFAAWMPVDKQFHELWNLGEIVFDRPPRVKIVSVDWNDPAWGANSAQVLLRNQEDQALAGQVRIEHLTATPIDVKLLPREHKSVEVPYAIRDRGKRVRLTLQVSTGEELLASRQSEVELPPEVFQVRPREEVLWTGEERLPVDFELHVGAATVGSLRIEMTIGTQALSFTPGARRGTCVIPIPKQGPVSLTARLLCDGDLVEQRSFAVTRHPSPTEW